MFGKNPVAPIESHGDGRHLRVVKGSPFVTIQGEGPYAGHPATFVRLHGCNLRCWFCDTQFSDPDDPAWLLDELLAVCFSNDPELIVITGGEPLRQNIVPLCFGLHEGGHLVQIETAGTLWLPGLDQLAEIVVSPKTPVIHPEILEHAKAFKYVVDIEQEFDAGLPVTATQPGATPRRLAAPRTGAPVYYSPMDTYDEKRNAANRKLAANLAIEFNRIAGIQLHKFLGVD